MTDVTDAIGGIAFRLSTTMDMTLLPPCHYLPASSPAKTRDITKGLNRNRQQNELDFACSYRVSNLFPGWAGGFVLVSYDVS